MSESLADKVIEQNDIHNANKDAISYWGIDEVGFPWPKPVTAMAVACRVIARYGSPENIFKIRGDLFIYRRKMAMGHLNSKTLMASCGKPEIVLWADEKDTKAQDQEFWRQVKRIINTEAPLVWSAILDLVPEYNKDYIRISGDLVWDVNNAKVIISPTWGEEE